MAAVKKKSLLTMNELIGRLIKNGLVGLVLISLSMFFGMCGYHFLEGLSWLDAFLNASMILSGMGPVDPLHTTAGKLFAGFYALFSGLAFIAIIALIFAPVVHRFIHKIHLLD
jgi:hypothetical protein